MSKCAIWKAKIAHLCNAQVFFQEDAGKSHVQEWQPNLFQIKSGGPPSGADLANSFQTNR